MDYNKFFTLGEANETRIVRFSGPNVMGVLQLIPTERNIFFGDGEYVLFYILENGDILLDGKEIRHFFDYVGYQGFADYCWNLWNDNVVKDIVYV